jgi:hypothetical protein
MKLKLMRSIQIRVHILAYETHSDQSLRLTVLMIKPPYTARLRKQESSRAFPQKDSI